MSVRPVSSIQGLRLMRSQHPQCGTLTMDAMFCDTLLAEVAALEAGQALTETVLKGARDAGFERGARAVRLEAQNLLEDFRVLNADTRVRLERARAILTKARNWFLASLIWPTVFFVLVWFLP